MMPNGYPSRKDAETLLTWAEAQNPGLWADHSRVVARVAETIAMHCGMDGDKAYVLGLLHDIGRHEGTRDLHHLLAGYNLLHRDHYDVAARICLTHSFPCQDIRAYKGKLDSTEAEIAFLKSELAAIQYDDYDRLIQLGDALGSAQGVVLIDVRVLDVIRRYGFNGFTLRKLDAIFLLKSRFDSLANMNLCDLFREEICRNCIR